MVNYEPINQGEGEKVVTTSTHSREEIITTLQSQKSRLQSEFPLYRLALFGSWARNEQTESSDVDILVEVDPSIGLRFVALAEQLDALLGYKVDLVSRRAIRPQMWEAIEPDLIDV
jgi:predicted nucleotidyltransferase